MAMRDEQIKEVIESDAMKAKVEDSSTQERIRKDFDGAFAKIKDRLGESWRDVRTIYDMAFDKSFDMNNRVKYAVLGALAYLVFPIDLLPDSLGPLGYADDIAVLYWAISYARPEIERYRKFKGEEDVIVTDPVTPPAQDDTQA